MQEGTWLRYPESTPPMQEEQGSVAGISTHRQDGHGRASDGF
ncbi:hypothetical protein [Ktedonobacter robiniae]|nr:hypothetical protein [Ktedonobacter robiniae]